MTLVAGLYWNQYVSSMLLSCGRSVSSLLRGAPSAERKEEKGVSVKRLLSYMLPYSRRFVAVLFLVILSSYGESGHAVDPVTPLVCSSLMPRKKQLSSCRPNVTSGIMLVFFASRRDGFSSVHRPRG